MRECLFYLCSRCFVIISSEGRVGARVGARGVGERMGDEHMMKKG